MYWKYLCWWNWQNFISNGNKNILTSMNYKCCFIKKSYEDQIDEQNCYQKMETLYRINLE